MQKTQSFRFWTLKTKTSAFLRDKLYFEKQLLLTLSVLAPRSGGWFEYAVFFSAPRHHGRFIQTDFRNGILISSADVFSY